MKNTQSYQAKLLNVAKLTLVLAILCFIVYKLFFAYHIQQLAQSFVFEWSYTKLALLLAVTILLFGNIFLEARKWQLIITKHEEVSFPQALKSVLAGITLGIITPNRIGDFAGKALFLQTYDKIKGAISSIIGSIAQILASLMFGSFGIWGLAWNQGYISDTFFYGGLAAITFLLTLVYFAYINIQWIEGVIKWQKAKEYIAAFAHYNKSELTTILLISGIRFLAYSSQYFLLLTFFGVEISVLHAALALFSIYLVQIVVPSFILIEVGVRGASALYFIGLFSDNTTGILLSAYSLWIINLMIPGLLGLYFILKLKWRSSQ